jgi:hypothetical protein
MSTEEKIAMMRREFAEARGREAAEYIEAKTAVEFSEKLAMVPTESPVEQLLVAQMLVSGWACQMEKPGRVFLYGDGVVCLAQAPATIGGRTYRSDFGCLPVVDGAPGSRRVAVEIDGHDFHDRTKEQASADRRRDRAFLSAGITVIRFTGSDVYRDPAPVLSEIVALVTGTGSDRK